MLPPWADTAPPHNREQLVAQEQHTRHIPVVGVDPTDDHVFTLTHKVTYDICESQHVTRKNNENMNLLTAKQTAQKLGVTLGTLYRMVRAGVIPTVRIGTGRSLRFDFEEVKSALTRSPSAASSPQKAKDDPLFNLPKLAIETGIKDLAQHHDHYLYGIPIKPAVSPSRR
jgi:excisionase family DNA binding protein